MLTFFTEIMGGGCFGLFAMAILAAAGRADEHFEHEEYRSTSIPKIAAREQAKEVYDESD